MQMNKTFIYRDYVGEVKYPPDDYDDISCMRPIKVAIDRIIKSYNSEKVTPPKEISGEEGQIVWQAEYIHAEDDDDKKVEQN